MNNFNGKVFGNPLVTPMNSYTKKQMDDVLGDVKTALDTILAMQSEYIEGGKIEIPKDQETGKDDLVDDLIPPEGDGFDY